MEGVVRMSGCVGWDGGVGGRERGGVYVVGGGDERGGRW